MAVRTTVTAGMMTNFPEDLKLRHELKYPISEQQAYILSRRLEKVFKRDKNSGSHGKYRVSSLYFDDPYDRALREKLNGADKREKFRIRYYGEDTSFIRLEKKIKQRGLCSKLQTGLTKGECIDIVNGKSSFLIAKEDPLLQEFYFKLNSELLRPSCIVCYDREAFVYAPGNVRITLDLGLRSCRDPKRFFDRERPDMPMNMDMMGVLELKYDEFLPEPAVSILRGYCGIISSNSKYALSRSFE